LDALENITKSEFMAHFEKVFFSDASKRLDL
jgi:nucleoside-diphosphate kinase